MVGGAGALMAKAIKVGKGRSQVTVTGALAEDLMRDFRQILAPVNDAMQAEADGIMRDEIAKKWPIKSGKSRDGWTTVDRVEPGTSKVEVLLVNPVPYVRFINSAKLGKKADRVRVRSPYRELRKPVSAARRRLKKVLPAILATGIQGRIDNGN